MSAGTIQFSQYRSNVRSLVGDVAYDMTLTDQAINWFINEVHNNNHIRYMETEDDLSVSADDLTVDLPDDLNTIMTLTLISPLVLDLMRYRVEYGDFMRLYPGYATYSPRGIMQWTDFNNAMRLAAPALADSDIHIDYLRVPTPMVNDTDTTDMPDQYEELISKGGLARLMEINEDYEEAANERDNLKPLLVAFIANEGRGGLQTGPTVMRTNRGRAARGVYDPSRDF